MSEFQFYEFAKVDRPLTEAEKAEIGSWSSRSSPTNYSVIFEYNYSDFPNDERKVVEHYFDAMFYFANWGATRFILKIPIELVNYHELRAFHLPFEGEYYGEGIQIDALDDNVLIDIYWGSDYGDWIEVHNMLDQLLPIRKQIIEGDYRALYLGWLHFVSQYWHYDEDVLPNEVEKIREPIIPPNLQKPERCLEAFIEAFGMNHQLINRVANESPFDDTLQPDYFALLSHLSEAEKDEYLREVIKGEPNIGGKIKRRLMNFVEKKEQFGNPKRRSFQEMKAIYGKIG